MLTSAREPQAPYSGTGPGDELSEFKRGLTVVGATAIGLPERAVRGRKVNAKQALRDMRVPHEVKDVLAGPLQELNYALDEAEVHSRFRAQDVRWISVVRGGADTRHLLHIPRAVLKNENNGEVFGDLRAFFSKGSTVYIISPKLTGFPHQSFALRVDEWKDSDNIDVYFINWGWLQESGGANPDLNAFAKLFKPPLRRSNGDPSPADQPPAEDHGNALGLTLQNTSTSFQLRNDGGGRNVMAGLNLSKMEIDRIVSALAQLAYTYAPGQTAYYKDLIARTDLPWNWKVQFGTWTGDALADARGLVEWAIAKDTNPNDARYTTLGSLLSVVLADQGLEQQNNTVALIYAHNLYRDKDLLSRLVARYQVPVAASGQAIADQAQRGPAFELREPLSDVELQRMFVREPGFLDVGFLSEAIKAAASVCRVETADGEPLGTGFLVAPRMLLTNYHVVDAAAGKDLVEKASNLLLRFRSVTAAAGRESEGHTYQPYPAEPLLRSSPVGTLDYALIQIEERITKNASLTPARYDDSQALTKGAGLNILGHPEGGPMKLAISGNGIVGVYSDDGLVQYATRALNGSSGSPCFDDSWRPVAIHHAERAKPFGAVREGILLEPIFNEIRSLL